MFKGLGNFAALFKQAQQLGERLQSVNDGLKSQRAVGRAGGDLIEVEVNGVGQVLKVSLDAGLVARGDRELLEELIPAAVNQALTKAKDLHAEAMRNATGGMDFAGLSEMLTGSSGNPTPPS